METIKPQKRNSNKQSTLDTITKGKSMKKKTKTKTEATTTKKVTLYAYLEPETKQFIKMEVARKGKGMTQSMLVEQLLQKEMKRRKYDTVSVSGS